LNSFCKATTRTSFGSFTNCAQS